MYGKDRTWTQRKLQNMEQGIGQVRRAVTGFVSSDIMNYADHTYIILLR